MCTPDPSLCRLGQATDRVAPTLHPERNSAIVSYCHVDEKWLNALQIALAPTVRHERLLVWADTKIRAGTKWRAEIAAAINRAKVAVLLVSPHFLASPFIAGHELPPLLAAAESEGLRIVWVLIHASKYQKTPIANYQAAHNIAKPLGALPAYKRHAVWIQITEAIEEAMGLHDEED